MGNVKVKIGIKDGKFLNDIYYRPQNMVDSVFHTPIIDLAVRIPSSSMFKDLKLIGWEIFPVKVFTHPNKSVLA